jgi:Derlin-2/3
MKSWVFLVFLLLALLPSYSSKAFGRSVAWKPSLQSLSAAKVLDCRGGAEKRTSPATQKPKRTIEKKEINKSRNKKTKKSARNTPEVDVIDSNEDAFEQEGESENGITFKAMSLSNIHIVDMIKDLYVKTPPMTRIFVLSSVSVTVLSFLFNNNKWPSWLHFDWPAILFGQQIWRLFSGFIYFGAFDVFYPLTMQFVWQHMSQLEKMNYNQPEEFLLMTLFGASALIILYTLLGISTRYLGHNLATYFVYIWARLFEGMDVSFMDLFVLKSELLPWFFCAQTFLLDQEFPIADLLGIAVGHVYHYLKQKKFLPCPTALKELFATDQMKQLYANFKDNFV